VGRFFPGFAKGTRVNYRFVLKLDGDEFEIGSIGIQHGAAWRWGIDSM
jgi:hypothetical protein